MFGSFDSKYPIVCLSMNGIAGIDFPIAISRSGVFPSIFVVNYIREGYDWVGMIKKDLELFRQELGHSNIIFAVPDDNFISDHKKVILDIVLNCGISHIEVLSFRYNNKESLKILSALRSRGVKIIYKGMMYPEDISYDNFDVVTLKCDKGAGKVIRSDRTIIDLVRSCRLQYPNIDIIASGGIANKQDIIDVLTAGATCAGIGTLFAFSAESPIAQITKESAIDNMKTKQIRSGSSVQNAIIFDEPKNECDINNTNGLMSSIKGKGGHIFAGDAIGHIKSIDSIETIVRRLAPVLGVEPRPSVLETDVLP